MFLCVHVSEGFKKWSCYETATRSAWHLNEHEAGKVHTVLGFIDGKCVCVREGATATRSTPENNHVHNAPHDDQRFVFLGGSAKTAKTAAFGDTHPLLFKQLSWGRGHRYYETI